MTGLIFLAGLTAGLLAIGWVAEQLYKRDVNRKEAQVMNSEDLYAAAKAAVIETQYGEFRPLAPTFDIRDIAAGLSKVCRFNGQCHAFYSVAEHSILVARIMQKLDLGSMREGLLHDGNEAYLPDVPSPYKHLLPDLKALESRVDKALRVAFGLPEEKTPGCAYADTLAVIIEAHDLLPSQATGPLWEPLAAYREEAMQLWQLPGFSVRCHRPQTAEYNFARMYEELTP